MRWLGTEGIDALTHPKSRRAGAPPAGYGSANKRLYGSFQRLANSLRSDSARLFLKFRLQALICCVSSPQAECLPYDFWDAVRCVLESLD